MKNTTKSPKIQGDGKANASARQRTKAKLTGMERQRVNNLRLSDITKLIEGRHGWAPTDLDWAERYFFAALPHLIMSRVRWLDAVRVWACANVPILLTKRGGDWIDAEARKCQAKDRKCPTTDKLAALLRVTVDEARDFELCTIPAASRPKAVRDADARKRRNEAKQAKREEHPDHTPRSSSKAAKARAKGTSANAIRAREWRAKRKAAARETGVKHGVGADCERVSGPAEDAIQTPVITRTERVSGPTIRIGVRTGFGPYNSTNPDRPGCVLH